MRVHTTSLLAVLMIIIGAIAPINGQVSKSCGHDHAQINHFGSQEAYDQAKLELLKKRAARPEIHANQKSNTAHTIPIVFHVIHDGEPVGTGKNLADGQVMAQLSSLNADFTASNDNFGDATRAAWDEMKGSPMISFCLATTDPDGIATSGIIRHNIAITGTDANNNNIEEVKDSINWDPNNYMNVYVLSIPGTSAQGGVVGYAYLPFFGTVGEGIDGVVVDYNWFGGEGYTQSGNKTLTHETGHYLGLLHTFSGNDCNEDDGLSDTPNMSTASSDLDPFMTCGNAMNPYPTGPASCGEEHMYINYMDYVNDDNCPTAFSGEQAVVMRGVLEGTEPGFTSRADLVANTPTACAGATICDLFASTSFTAITCNSTSDGTATVAATGGTGPYTYEWTTDPSQTTAVATNLSSGTYFVTVTDNNGCSVAVNVVIPEHVPLSLQSQSQGISSPGATDGQASVSVTGGELPYTYVWSNGATTAAVANLAAGSYTVTVTDVNNCSSSLPITIDDFECQPFDISYSGGEISCFGDSETITITNVNSPGPHTYLWNTSETTSSITITSGGIYIATVTDSLGCSDSVTIVIDEPDALAIDVSKQDVSQLGGSDGQITLTVTGGTVSYTYTWADGPTTASRTGLSPGTYSVTVTDSNLCTETESVTISEVTCGAIDISPTTTDISCFGVSDGGVALNIQQIKAPYTILWSNGATTENLDNLSGGTYGVTLTDADACELTASFSISEPAALIMSGYDILDNLCHQDAQGRVSVNVAGGITPYRYSWSNDADASTIQGLSAGAYEVTVSDANNCTVAGSASVTEPTAINVDRSISHVSAIGAADGSIDLNITGGVPSYNISWNTGAATSSLTNLSEGTYTYTVTDDNGCIISDSIIIEQYVCPEISVDIALTSVSCRGASDGSLVASTSGGDAPYTYQWSTANASGSVIENLAAGTYSVTTVDSKGCTTSATATIIDPELLTYTVSVSDETGNESEDGTATLSIEGGQAPYTVVWSDGGTGEGRTDLAPGQYVFEIQDSYGCSISGSAVISSFVCPQIQASVSVVNNECTEGGVDVLVQGGTAPYIYIIDSETYDTDSIRGLSSGSYELQAIDANGCEDIVSFEIDSPAELVVDSLSWEDASDIFPGKATIIVSGGVEPYSYSWSDGRTNATNNALFAGVHTVIVTDAAGCSISQEVVIHHNDASGLEDGLMLFESHPNPASNQVRLQAEFDEPTYMRITITSLSGSPMFSDELETDIYNLTVDISGYAPGIYTVTIFTENNVTTSSLVKL